LTRPSEGAITYNDELSREGYRMTGIGAMERIRMKEVVEAAGVSFNTVRRALLGKPNASHKTKARVLTVAEQLGYRPNKLAEGLRSDSSFLLTNAIAEQPQHISK